LCYLCNIYASKPNKDLEETSHTILDKLTNLQTQIQKTYDHHEARYITLHHNIEMRQKDWESHQEADIHTLHIVLTSIPPPLFSPQ